MEISSILIWNLNVKLFDKTRIDPRQGSQLIQDCLQNFFCQGGVYLVKPRIDLRNLIMIILLYSAAK